MPAISRFGPPLVLMAVIFFLSAQPDLSSGLQGWDLILRKLAHMTEYGVLYLLWRRALPAAPGWTPVAIALAYAATDEWHQTFVTGRHGTPVDVLIDAVGIGLAIVAERLLIARKAG
jgi:VanZ family protein